MSWRNFVQPPPGRVSKRMLEPTTASPTTLGGVVGCTPFHHCCGVCQDGEVQSLQFSGLIPPEWICAMVTTVGVTVVVTVLTGGHAVVANMKAIHRATATRGDLRRDMVSPS